PVRVLTRVAPDADLPLLPGGGRRLAADGDLAAEPDDGARDALRADGAHGADGASGHAPGRPGGPGGSARLGDGAAEGGGARGEDGSALPLPRPAHCLVTAANRLAHRAVERFVMAPAAGWNPLFLYGPAGTGKTELARHALARLEEAGELHDPLVLSGPALMRDVARAARTGTLAQLQQEWLARHVLVLDEAHRLRGQRRSQAEAASLVSGMLERGRRVLVLSRHAPRQIVDADARLQSLFLSGMVVSLAEPDTADREAVLAAIAHELPGRVLPGVTATLAARCPGTLTDAVRMLQRTALDAAAAGQALSQALLDRRLSGPTPVENSLGAVIATISEVTGVAGARIRSAEKSRDVAAARHLCVYLATRSLGLSARQVCRALNLSSPSIAAYARRIIEQRRAEDPSFDQLVHRLQARLEGAQRDFAW
ncbi:MAG TPA: DnaA/Hda family protein, partial [Planctomycetota bacterium]|nr:DnaA/Hda family protein [Planctomycetota bacterium]